MSWESFPLMFKTKNVLDATRIPNGKAKPATLDALLADAHATRVAKVEADALQAELWHGETDGDAFAAGLREFSWCTKIELRELNALEHPLHRRENRPDAVEKVHRLGKLVVLEQLGGLLQDISRTLHDRRDGLGLAAKAADCRVDDRVSVDQRLTKVAREGDVVATRLVDVQHRLDNVRVVGARGVDQGRCSASVLLGQAAGTVGNARAVESLVELRQLRLGTSDDARPRDLDAVAESAHDGTEVGEGALVMVWQ